MKSSRPRKDNFFCEDTAQPSPQKPGTQEKTKGDFIAVEMRREFPDQNDLE
jgi:hypothetical protein